MPDQPKHLLHVFPDLRGRADRRCVSRNWCGCMARDTATRSSRWTAIPTWRSGWRVCRVDLSGIAVRQAQDLGKLAPVPQNPARHRARCAADLQLGRDRMGAGQPPGRQRCIMSISRTASDPEEAQSAAFAPGLDAAAGAVGRRTQRSCCRRAIWRGSRWSIWALARQPGALYSQWRGLRALCRAFARGRRRADCDRHGREPAPGKKHRPADRGFCRDRSPATRRTLELLIVGDGAERPQLGKLARQHWRRAQVRFAGPEQPAGRMAAADGYFRAVLRYRTDAAERVGSHGGGLAGGGDRSGRCGADGGCGKIATMSCRRAMRFRGRAGAA